MMTKTKWPRVSPQRPCPVCGRPDWCLYTGPANGPTAAIYPRVESRKRAGQTGCLHVLCNDGPTRSLWARRIELSAGPIGNEANDFGVLTADVQAAIDGAHVRKLSVSRRIQERAGKYHGS